jgi:hypothetical protein
MRAVILLWRSLMPELTPEMFLAYLQDPTVELRLSTVQTTDPEGILISAISLVFARARARDVLETDR